MLRRLTDDITASGELARQWRPAFLAVPRHCFIPDVVWREDSDSEDDNNLLPLSRAEDPDTWLSLAYADEAVITQVDDGHPAGPGLIGREVSSSASQPSVVALMLAALGADPGMTVCEVGTGTGYNAALLACRLSAGNVTTIEIDPQVAAAAAKTLRAAGYGGVTVVTGDGALGCPDRAPYDRVLATACVYHVPYAWVAQTKPGGRVLTPWRTEYHNGGLLALSVADDGTASGHIVGNVAFMTLRQQRNPRASLRAIIRDDDSTTTSRTDLHPYRVAGDYDASFAIGLRVPRCRTITWPPDKDTGEATVWFVDQWSRSWASLHYTPDATEHTIRQAGERHLWDEVEAAYHRWRSAGSPKASDWQLTITPQGQSTSVSRGRA